MSKPPEQDPAMNITQNMWNCTHLPQMIEFMRNTTEKDHCFMRAFLAPLCWATVLQNSSHFSPDQLGNLLWAAKPFLEAAPPTPLSLPSRLQRAHLVEMMKLFSEVFSSLSEENRDEIKRWMKERVTENEPLCHPVQNISSTLPPTPPKPSAMTKLEPATDNQGLQTGPTNWVTSGDKALKRARRGLAARQGLGQGNLKVTQPSKIVENPVKAEIPANPQNPDKLSEVPVNQQNPNKPAETPGSQQNPSTLAELPVNQMKNPGASNDTLPQTPGNSDKTEKELSKVEEVTEQGDKKETVGQNPGKQDDSGKQIDVGNGNGKNESKEHMVPEEPSTAKEEKETGKDGQKQQSEGSADDGGKNKSNSSPAGCPRMPWLKAEALRMMGRFFSRLPEVEVKAIPTEELCKFFVTPEFPSSFAKVDGMQPAISRMLFQRLKQECSNSSQNFLTHVDRLGSLVCFFDDARSLNATLSKKLLSQMADCENAGIDQIRRDLMRKVMSNGDVPPTLELLRTLGSSVSILPPSKLSDFSADTLKDGLASLSQVKWKPVQARILAQKLLEKVKNVTGESLLSLGSMVRGVDSEILRKVKLQGLLGNEALKNMTEKMSSLQKKALLEGLRSSLNESDLVKKVPDPLLPSLSLFFLEKAGISSVDQLEGRSWSRTQSVYLVKKILGQGIKPEQIRRLGQAVQGVTCSMIDSVNQSDTLTTVQTLANSSNWLSRTQVRCIAQKLFLSLEKLRPGYFVNITGSELQAIPALLLIHLPIKAIQGLPATVCPRFLEKMSQANLTSLPNSAPSRWELRDRALRCLGKNASDLSSAEVLSLGPLVCELDPAWMSSLNPAALNATLQALASCEHIPRLYRAPLFTLITRVYGAPSIWTEDVMKLMGPLLLLNDTSLEVMPFKSWLKSSLSDLLGSLQPQTAAPHPEEFRSWPDLLALRRKLFQLKTNPILQRRRRESEFTEPQIRQEKINLFKYKTALEKHQNSVSPSVVPSVSVMEDLGEGNVYWSPAQLANMSAQTFREAVPVLGEIRNFTAEHLAVLREKAIEALGDASMLNQTQIVELGCICQGFNTKDLQKLNITSLDTLELLSICNWNYTQKVAIWQGFIERTGIKMAKLGALEMTGLGNFICGLQPDQIDQLSTAEFKEAVEDIGHAKCPVTVLECLKRKAISAFGDPKNWGEAEASMMGNIIAGLNGTELASLNSSVLPFIRQSAIPLILPERLATMSVNQLKSLGPDNAAMVTETQRSGLGVEQRAAVNESLGLPTSRSETSTSAPVAVPQKGGAPQQSVLGIAVLPVVLLLLGFLL
ncbi:otoancorin [Colossoma macropomum]|uniref:otoancorin n=1 Tax=Colossoma macropomum TaxID=42526 RepID=UPI001863AA5A|nr:otoancorin [Colossoma macropomum]